MAKAELSIRLKKPDTTYCPGDVLDGEVEVDRGKNEKKGTLKIKRFWKTHGRGNTARGGESEVVLHSAQSKSQGVDVYPFSMKVPNGPFTYHGTLLNVDWYVQARLDVAWALDPKTEISFGVHPGPEPPPAPAELKESIVSKATSKNTTLVLAIMGSLFAMVGGAVMFGMILDSDSPLFAALFPGIFLLVGLGLLFASMRNRLAARKLGVVQFDVAPREVGPGQQVACHLQFIPKSAISLNHVKITLKCEEVVVRGSGTDRTTYREDIHEESHSLALNQDLRQGMPFDQDLTFELPARSPLSFSATDNELIWKVSCQIDIDKWPDWNKDQAFVVWPQRALSSAPLY
jgi:hypothetical protein